MKTATGELNMTVIIIAAVAILSVFFYTVIWPLLKENQEAVTQCKDAICGTNVDNNGMTCCHLKGEAAGSCSFKCAWKG